MSKGNNSDMKYNEIFALLLMYSLKGTNLLPRIAVSGKAGRGVAGGGVGANSMEAYSFHQESPQLSVNFKYL